LPDLGRPAYPMRGEVTNRAVLGRNDTAALSIRVVGCSAVGTTSVAANSEA
jgi:hypothetical protein